MPSLSNYRLDAYRIGGGSLDSRPFGELYLNKKEKVTTEGTAATVVKLATVPAGAEAITFSSEDHNTSYVVKNYNSYMYFALRDAFGRKALFHDPDFFNRGYYHLVSFMLNISRNTVRFFTYYPGETRPRARIATPIADEFDNTRPMDIVLYVQSMAEPMSITHDYSIKGVFLYS